MNLSMLFVLLTAVLFTTLEPVSKLISADVSPLVMTLMRFLIGGVMLLPFAVHKIRKNRIKLSLSDWAGMAALGALCICVSMLMLQFAVLKADSPAVIAIVFSSTSVFTVLLSAVILRDKLTPVKGLGVALGLIGVLLCADFSAGTNALSVLLAVAAALTFSLYTVLSKKMMGKVSGVIQTAFSFLFGSAVLAVVLLIMRAPIAPAFELSRLPVLLFLGIGVTGIGYWSYFKAMDLASAMSASLVYFIKPVLTPLAAFLINGIVPGVNVYFALVLVLAGSWLATRAKSLRLPWSKKDGSDA